MDNTVINELSEKEELISTDFSNITKIDNTYVETKGNLTYVTLEEDDCKLICVYDENGNLISKELIDTRPTAGIINKIIC